MTKIQVYAPVEPLDIEIGDRTIHAVMSLDPSSLLSMADTAQKAAPKMTELEKLLEDAKARGDEGAASRIERDHLDLQRNCIVPIIGEETYQEIVDALTLGGRVPIERCTTAITQISRAITDAIDARNGRLKSAVHRPAEAAHAQTDLGAAQLES